MKRNGMCPICFIRSLFRQKPVDSVKDVEYVNNARTTPLMGWSTWNTFANNVSEKLILETADAMIKTGLKDAGYIYVNIDDNWQSGARDNEGNLVSDFTTFPRGIAPLVKDVNAKGLKLGIYSSNGTHTCEDMPAGINNEYKDAYTYAKWGCEYLKYDFCHNIKISPYAPLIYGIEVALLGTDDKEIILCNNAKLEGLAKFMPCKKLDNGQFISGLDRGQGKAIFKVNVEKAGNYSFTTLIRKYGKKYEKFLTVKVNGNDTYFITYPGQKKINVTARFQTIIPLNEGENVIELFNPITKSMDSAKLLYRKMANALVLASQRVAKENNEDIKPITFSICEWGFRKPWLWGYSAGNMWRTTPDIKAFWPWMMLIYSRNVKLYKYASTSHFNDPDMLEVGNGKLTYDENMSHFALWCMMAAPLVLGNDIRNITKPVLNIITNKDLIAIDQDKLCKQAKRIIKGKIDVLAKPLVDGIAVCFFNKGGNKKNFKFDPTTLIKDDYIAANDIKSYEIQNIIGEVTHNDKLVCADIPKHGVVVYKYKK